MAQAKRDLEHAAKDVVDGYYEHACFEAQQAAEKAVKGVYMRYHADAWGHRVARLLEEFDVAARPDRELIDDAKLLDQLYVPTRYPNGLPDLSPDEAYCANDAAEGVQFATPFVELADGALRWEVV